MIPVTKSCHKLGCELHANCALYKAEKAQLQIIPQYCGGRCEFYTPKEQSSHASDRESSPLAMKSSSAPSEDFQHATDMAGCLE